MAETAGLGAQAQVAAVPQAIAQTRCCYRLGRGDDAMRWARSFGTGLVGRAGALLHGLRRKGDHPSRYEFRPDSRGNFDELVARFKDGLVFFEDLGENGLFVDLHWNDGRGVRLWVAAKRGCLIYNHEIEE